MGLLFLSAALSETGGLAEASDDMTCPDIAGAPQTSPPLAERAAAPLSFIFWTPSDCDYMACYQNNPFNTYAMLALPTDPAGGKTTCTKQDIISGACTHKFQLSGEDAILIWGNTFSQARYFNFLLNQVDRSDGEGGRELTESSIGLGINHLTMRTFDPDPLGGRFCMIVTASHTTSAILKNYLLQIGVPEAGINEYLIHRDFANGHLGEDADTLNIMYRVSTSEIEALEAHAATSPLKAMLFRGPPSAVGDVVTMAEWAPRPDTAETVHEADMMTLAIEVLKHYWPAYEMPDLIYPEGFNRLDPEECRGEVAAPEKCRYDNPDSVYNNFKLSETQPIRFTLDEDDFIVFVGMNHGYFDLSTYLVYFLYRDRDYRGFSAFEDVNMIGSAQQYWPEADERFFAFKMALNCNGDPWCHEIEQGESGIVPGEPFILSGRIYLDPQSETGPDPGNFLSSFILLYKD